MGICAVQAAKGPRSDHGYSTLQSRNLSSGADDIRLTVVYLSIPSSYECRKTSFCLWCLPGN
jgi:hypothetical protein